MTVKELKDNLALTEFSVCDDSRTIDGVYAGDLLSWVMGHGSQDNCWITIMSNKNVAAVASLLDFSCVILAEGVSPDDELKAAAEARGINILGSGAGIYEVCTQLYSMLKA